MQVPFVFPQISGVIYERFLVCLCLHGPQIALCYSSAYYRCRPLPELHTTPHSPEAGDSSAFLGNDKSGNAFCAFEIEADLLSSGKAIST